MPLLMFWLALVSDTICVLNRVDDTMPAGSSLALFSRDVVLMRCMASAESLFAAANALLATIEFILVLICISCSSQFVCDRSLIWLKLIWENFSDVYALYALYTFYA